MEKGKAAVWTGAYSIELRSLPIPEVRDDGVLLRVEAAGVCGTDGHLIQQNPPYDAILSHEITGCIVAMGDRANGSLNVYGGPLAVGDRIVLYPWITCGRCTGCLRHRPGTCTVCNNSFVYGVPYSKLGLDGSETISSSVEIWPYFKGGFAEYLYVLPGTYVWKIPDDMPAEVATLLDPLAVAVRAIELAQTCPGTLEEAFTTSSSIVVLGAGPVGVLAALVSRLTGVEKVIVCGGREARLRLAQEIARVDEVIDIHELTVEERIKRVKALTNGGADVVLQCANTPEAFVQGLEMLRRLGTLVEVGNMVNVGHKIPLDPARQVCGKHARIIGMSANHPGAFDKAFHLLKRHENIPFKKLFTHETTLEGVLNTLRAMKDTDYMKGLVRP